MNVKKKFKLGDRVKIISSQQTFYSGMYNLTTCIGIIKRTNKSCTYIDFNNSGIEVAVLTGDIELASRKGEQLEFAFMRTGVSQSDT